MVTLPKSNFRGITISFDEFCDLAIIGMSGQTDYLLKSSVSPHADGMVNYKLVADSLGLMYEPNWIADFGHQVENGAEALVMHDSAPSGRIDDENWVYLNSGFNRIASLLYEKYYIPPAIYKLNYDEFRDVLLFELAGMAQDGITQDGKTATASASLSYDLAAVVDHLDLPHEAGWIERAAAEWIAQLYIVAVPPSAPNQVQHYRLTNTGYQHAQTLSETVGQGCSVFSTE